MWNYGHFNRTAFLIETKNKEQCEKSTNKKTIKTYGCTVEKYGRFNHIKWLIFLTEFEIEDMQEFKERWQESYCIVDVERASYIKARSGATAYVITFNQEHIHFSIYIISEKQDTRMQPFENTHMIRNKCQSYGHTAKRCNEETVCKQFAEKGRSKQECQKSGEEYKCVYCGGKHMTGSRACEKQIRERVVTNTNAAKGDFCSKRRIQMQQKAMSQFGLREVIEASWIKVKNNRTNPLLLHLKGNKIPTYLEIPGEQDKSRVYEYKYRPSMCQKCLEHGHRTEFCTNKMKCRKCYEETHIADECQREDCGCYHCRGSHRSGSRICPQYRYVEEIEAI